ncbi:MAG: hypothetical protein J7J17_03290 [Hadesarchaea archaeon]|nr:hypothetical protein [Hadesarchaea archaeon]
MGREAKVKTLFETRWRLAGGRKTAEASTEEDKVETIDAYCSKCGRVTVHVFERELPDGGRLYRCFWCSSPITRH